MSLKLIPVTASELPVSKVFTLGTEELEFIFRKNTREDFITLEIRKDGTVLQTMKLCYGHNLFRINRTGIPFAVLPLTEDDLYQEGFSDVRVNSLTLGKTVFLYFDDGV